MGSGFASLASSFPPLHVSGSPPDGTWATHWRPEESVLVTVFALVAGYLLWIGPIRPDAGTNDDGASQPRAVRPGQVVAFLSGCLALVIALGPPIDDWSQYFLLSAHMVQHLILTLLVPPLLLLGIPGWMIDAVVRRVPVLGRVGFVLTRPVAALLLSGVAVAAWHLPPLYVGALRSEPLHILEHQAYLLTGLLAWWPLCGSYAPWPKLSPPMQCLYLFASTIPTGVVGAIITMADPGLYPTYGDAPRRLWGLSVATDQEIAGLLMWVGGNTIFLLLITVIFLRWAASEERQDRDAAASVPSRPVPPRVG